MAMQASEPSGTAVPPDAELAVRAGAGDAAALAVIFDRYARHLLAFCRSMLRTTADAEDCLQDVFVIAARRLAGLREPERLRSWLFAVARHECLARVDRRGREVPVDAVPETVTPDPDRPASAALDADLGRLLADAIAGLGDRDRLVLELADRHGLPTDEVASVVGESPATTLRLLSRARATARRAIGALLVARTGRADCAELDAMLRGWSGELTPLLRKRIARHVEDCPICGERERRLATPAALLGVAPLPVIPLLLRSRVLAAAGHHAAGVAAAGHASLGVSNVSGVSGVDGWRHGWPPGSRPVARHLRWRAATAGAAAVAVIVLALLVIHPKTGAPPRGGGRATLAAVTPTAGGTAPARPAPGASTSPTSPGGATTGATGSSTAPVIDKMTVECVVDNGMYVPRLTWATRRDTGIALSVDNPGLIGSYGHYGPSGTLILPPNGCRPADGTQIYTITTVGGTGPAASRTIMWQPPTDLPPIPSPSPSPSPSAVVLQ